MCVSGMEAERCVEFLDKPGSSLGVTHGCCALRRKRSNNKSLIHRDEMQRQSYGGVWYFHNWKQRQKIRLTTKPGIFENELLFTIEMFNSNMSALVQRIQLHSD